MRATLVLLAAVAGVSAQGPVSQYWDGQPQAPTGGEATWSSGWGAASTVTETVTVTACGASSAGVPTTVSPASSPVESLSVTLPPKPTWASSVTAPSYGTVSKASAYSKASGYGTGAWTASSATSTPSSSPITPAKGSAGSLAVGSTLFGAAFVAALAFAA